MELNKIAKNTLTFFILPALLFVPIALLAATTLQIPCDGPDCDFTSFITLINNFIDFLITYIAAPLAVLSFIYAGFMLVTSGGSEERKTKAKSVFTKVVIGFVIVLSAWLIVKFITVALLDPNNFTDLLSKVNLIEIS